MKKRTSKYKVASCLCGGIKIKTKAKLRHVINCHCLQCMKTHGNYSAYTACLEKKLIFVSKKSLKWYNSSKNAKRGFCTSCGASVLYKLKKSESISVAAGMFKNPTKLKTKYNIFIKGKLDYYKLDNKIPKYNKFSK